MKASIIVLSALLAGCGMAQQGATQEGYDNEACLRTGAVYGTPAYAQCRQRINQQHQQAAVDRQQGIQRAIQGFQWSPQVPTPRQSTSCRTYPTGGGSYQTDC